MMNKCLINFPGFMVTWVFLFAWGAIAQEKEVTVVDIKVVVDGETTKTHKTKVLRNHILSLKPENAETVLLVNAKPNDNLALAARNLPLLNLVQADTLNTYQVLWPDVVILSKEALETVTERLNKKQS